MFAREQNSAKSKKRRLAQLEADSDSVFQKLRKYTKHPYSYKPRKRDVRMLLQKRLASYSEAKGYFYNLEKQAHRRKIERAIRESILVLRVPEYAIDYSGKSEAFYLYFPRSKHDWTCVRFASHAAFYGSSAQCMQVNLVDMPRFFPELRLFMRVVISEALGGGPSVPNAREISQVRASAEREFEEMTHEQRYELAKSLGFRGDFSKDDAVSSAHTELVRLHASKLRSLGLPAIKGPTYSRYSATPLH